MSELATNLKIKDCISNPEDKKEYNQVHFTESAPRYDIATKALSLGCDSYWKEKLICELPEITKPKCIDLACGTGDICFLLAAKYPQAQILGVDLTKAMIDIAERKNSVPFVSFECGDMSELSASDGSVDIITGSYALRNAPDLVLALSEIRRVLKAGGIAAFLDFSKPRDKVAQEIQYWVLKAWGSFWGLMLHRNRQVHGYISESMKTYPNREELRALFEKEGFRVKSQRGLFFGMTEILVVEKL